MTWVSDYTYSWYELLAMNVVRAGGNIPRHIAFVMDGNRRYARSERIKKTEGHSRGFDKLANCLRWCLDMGIKEVTAFAFSIENLKRSEEEVNGLLDLARDKFGKLLQEESKLHEHGVRLRVIGNMALLPKDIQQLIAKAMLDTEKNNKLFLNIAFSYTSRDEIAQAAEVILQQGQELDLENINERLVEECLYTRHSSFPDLLFRTSGETRISDFLMWQLKTSVLYFANVLWPQITIWNFLAGLFSYQRAVIHLDLIKRYEHRQHVQSAKDGKFYSDKVQSFLNQLDIYRKDVLLKMR